MVILFADDDPWFVEPFVAELGEAGFEVLEATNGSAVLDLLDRRTIDLIILDIMMPVGDRLEDPSGGKRTGVHVAEYIRNKLKSTVPIIYFTVVSEPDLVTHIESFEKPLGIYSKVLVKPILPTDLLDDVESILANKNSSEE